MRPKKRILLIDKNEIRLSIRRLMLAVNRFAVSGACDRRQVADALAEHSIDVVLIVAPFAGAVQVLHECRLGAPYAPQVALIEGTANAALELLVDATLPASYPNAELIQSLRVMAQRKKGPKKPVQPAAAGDSLARRWA